MERSERVQWRPFADTGSSPQIVVENFAKLSSVRCPDL